MKLETQAEIKLLNNVGSTSFLLLFNEAEINNMLNQQY